jgi:hypothetical protein
LQRADFLLQEMENGACHTSRPDGPLYAAVLNGFAEAGDVEMASNVLYRFVDAFLSNKNNERMHSLRQLGASNVGFGNGKGKIERMCKTTSRSSDGFWARSRNISNVGLCLGSISARGQEIYVKRIASKTGDREMNSRTNLTLNFRH